MHKQAVTVADNAPVTPGTVATFELVDAVDASAFEVSATLLGSLGDGVMTLNVYDVDPKTGAQYSVDSTDRTGVFTKANTTKLFHVDPASGTRYTVQLRATGGNNLAVTLEATYTFE